jgi:hypothetical protein
MAAANQSGFRSVQENRGGCVVDLFGFRIFSFWTEGLTPPRSPEWYCRSCRCRRGERDAFQIFQTSLTFDVKRTNGFDFVAEQFDANCVRFGRWKNIQNPAVDTELTRQFDRCDAFKSSRDEPFDQFIQFNSSPTEIVRVAALIASRAGTGCSRAGTHVTIRCWRAICFIQATDNSKSRSIDGRRHRLNPADFPTLEITALAIWSGPTFHRRILRRRGSSVARPRGFVSDQPRRSLPDSARRTNPKRRQWLRSGRNAVR